MYVTGPITQARVTTERGLGADYQKFSYKQMVRQGTNGENAKRIKPVTKNGKENLNYWVTNIIDSGLRALGRQAEVTFDLISQNQFARIPFRFASELVRNGSAQAVQNVLEDKKLSRSFQLKVLRKTLENTAATAFFEPNRYQNSFVRVGIGFLNMAVRFASRVALVAINVISPEDIEIDGLPDEFGSRSLGRIIRPFSESPVVGLLTRFGEQILINFGLEKMLLRNHVLSKLSESPKTSTVKAA